MLDFETTGLSPGMGDRPTELAVLLIRNGEVVHRMVSLMNPGRAIPLDVQHLTGITNAMVANAPSIASVLERALNVIGDHPIVAHNAAFDSRFWRSELALLPGAPASRFACTMLLARRLYPDAPNHRLGTLVALHGLPAGRAHRAMADTEMTYHLWRRMDQDVRTRFGGHALDFELMFALQKIKRQDLCAAVTKHFAAKKPGRRKTPVRRTTSVQRTFILGESSADGRQLCL